MWRFVVVVRTLFLVFINKPYLTRTTSVSWAIISSTRDTSLPSGCGGWPCWQFLSGNNFPGPEARLSVLLQEFATEKSARAPAEWNHHV